MAGARPSGGVQFTWTKEALGRDFDLLRARGAQDGDVMPLWDQTICASLFSRLRPVPNARPMDAGNQGKPVRAAQSFDYRRCWLHVANVATTAMKSQAECRDHRPATHLADSATFVE
jgi:hypothetical protein